MRPPENSEDLIKKLVGELQHNGFTVTGVYLPDDYCNPIFSIEAEGSDKAQAILGVFDQEQWTGSVCGYEDTPGEMPVDKFRPYYWVNSIIPGTYK